VIELFTSTRVQILSKLIERPYTASEIAKLTGYSKTTVSYHLSKLNEAGLVERLERGKWVYYRITPKGERRVKVEAAISLVSLAGAVISAVAFAMLRLQGKAVEKFAVAGEKEVVPTSIPKRAPVTIQEVGGGMDWQLLLLAAAFAFLLIFIFMRFRK